MPLLMAFGAAILSEDLAQQGRVQEPPRARRVDAATADPLGRADGANTAGVIAYILKRRIHPQHGFRACLGILRLSAAGSRVPACAGTGCMQLQKPRIDPAPRAAAPAAGPAKPAAAARRAHQPAWLGLLPLT